MDDDDDGDDVWGTQCCVCFEGGELVCCDGCPSTAHPGCVGLDSMPEEFFCPSCSREACAVCGEGRLALDLHVLCGSETQGCERVFHLRCVGLEAVPPDDWFCESCEDAKRSLVLEARIARTEDVPDATRAKAALAACAEARGSRAGAEAWLEARDAKVSLFRESASGRATGWPTRLRLVSFALKARRRLSWAHETCDLRDLIRHPVFETGCLAAAEPSPRYLRSWGRTTDGCRRVDDDEPRPRDLLVARARKRRRDFAASVGEVADGTDPRVQAAVRADPGYRGLEARAAYLLDTQTRSRVLTLAYADYLGIQRSVAVVELLAHDLRHRPGLRIDKIHLNLRDAYLDHYRHRRRTSST